LILLPASSYSNCFDAIFVKTKNIKKAYYVNSDAGINIDNSYGNVTLSTWDEDKIELDINIKVSGTNEAWVNQRINEIDVDINALKNLVSAKTILGNTNYRAKGNNNSFEINYIIKIPKKGGVTIRNKYGSIFANDLWSTTDLYCKYGKIATGKLYGGKNTIQMEYCPGSTIEYINYGAITARYSGLRIDLFSRIDLLSDYTDVNILEGDLIKYSSKYGTLIIEKAKSVEGTANYMTLKFGEINDNFKLTAKYCEITIDNLSAKSNDLAINAGYSNMKIGYNNNFAFDFDINVRYANFKYENDLIFSDREETNYSKSFQGYFNKKGLHKLTINSDYGNINLLKKY
jgi:hypothetical protein